MKLTWFENAQITRTSLTNRKINSDVFQDSRHAFFSSKVGGEGLCLGILVLYYLCVDIQFFGPVIFNEHRTHVDITSHSKSVWQYHYTELH